MVGRTAQVERMQHSQIFNPLHAMAHLVAPEDVDALKCFRFSHRPDLAAKLEEMKTELTVYNSFTKLIKPKKDRLVGAHGKAGDSGQLVDSFDMQLWWRANKAKLPAFFRIRILQAVAAHSPIHAFQKLCSASSMIHWIPTNY